MRTKILKWISRAKWGPEILSAWFRLKEKNSHKWGLSVWTHSPEWGFGAPSLHKMIDKEFLLLLKWRWETLLMNKKSWFVLTINKINVGIYNINHICQDLCITFRTTFQRILVYNRFMLQILVINIYMYIYIYIYMKEIWSLFLFVFCSFVFVVCDLFCLRWGLISFPLITLTLVTRNR